MSVKFNRVSGEILRIHLGLGILDDDKFVRAFLFNEDGVALVPPSVDLVNKGAGAYLDLTKTMIAPNTQIRADMVVFNDAAFNEPDCEHPGDTDYFELVSASSGNNIFVGSEFLTARVSEERLEANVGDEEVVSAEVKDEEKLSGTVTEEKVSATVSDPENVSGQTSEETVDGTVKGDC